MKWSLGISDFLKRSLVFPILLFSSISLHCSLKKSFLSPCYSLELCILLGMSFSFAFHVSSFLSYFKVSSDNLYPLQCSCLENPRDRGAWWAAVCGVAQSRTWLKWLSSSIRQSFCLLAFFFSLEWFWSLPPVQCYEPPSIVLQALCLLDLIP